MGNPATGGNGPGCFNLFPAIMGDQVLFNPAHSTANQAGAGNLVALHAVIGDKELFHPNGAAANHPNAGNCVILHAVIGQEEGVDETGPARNPRPTFRYTRDFIFGFNGYVFGKNFINQPFQTINFPVYTPLKDKPHQIGSGVKVDFKGFPIG